MATVKTKNGNIILFNDKVSTFCCPTCECEELTLEYLLSPEAKEFWDGPWSTKKPLDYYTPPPGNKARFRLGKACVAFLCRSVSPEGPSGTVLCSQTLGDPCIELTQAAANVFGYNPQKSALLNGECSGTYLYAFNFSCWINQKSPWGVKYGIGPNPPPGVNRVYYYNIPIYNVNRTEKFW